MHIGGKCEITIKGDEIGKLVLPIIWSTVSFEDITMGRDW